MYFERRKRDSGVVRNVAHVPWVMIKFCKMNVGDIYFGRDLKNGKKEFLILMYVFWKSALLYTCNVQHRYTKMALVKCRHKSVMDRDVLYHFLRRQPPTQVSKKTGKPGRFPEIRHASRKQQTIFARLSPERSRFRSNPVNITLVNNGRNDLCRWLTVDFISIAKREWRFSTHKTNHTCVYHCVVVSVKEENKKRGSRCWLVDT